VGGSAAEMTGWKSPLSMLGCEGSISAAGAIYTPPLRIAEHKGRQLAQARRATRLPLKVTAELTLEVIKLEQQINRILQGHRSYPHAWVSQESIRLSRTGIVRRKDPLDPMWPRDEFACVEVVLLLVQMKLMEKVRLCTCGRWYFRRFCHKEFCWAPCQQRAHRESEDYKQERRAYQRENYRLHRDKNIR
jgi:hypothetical protein